MSECWLEKPEDRPTFRRICAAMKRLINDRRTYVNLDVYNDKDYVNFDMVDELQWFLDEADSERGKVLLMNQ